MKIRQGFVSNSSSSSFVVAFPKKPKTAEETLKIMFGDDIDGVQKIYDYQLSNKEIAWQVFDDVRFKRSATVKAIVDLFRGRYYSIGNPIDIIFNDDGSYTRQIFDTPDLENYIGYDKELFDKILQLNKEHEKKEYEVSLKRDEIEKKIMEKVAPGYISFRPKTEKEFKERERLYRKILKAYNESKEWKEHMENSMEIFNNNFEERWAVIRPLAEVDAKKFKEDNKGKFFAVLRYSDGDPGGTVMEHGDIFHNLSHIRISEH